MPLNEMNPQGDYQATCYTAYGLTIQSDLPCPELLLGENAPEVVIQYAQVPEHLSGSKDEGVLYQATLDRFLLKLDHIARYLVQEGRAILIQRASQATDDEVRLFLLGSCLGALLHQRGVLALHASAIRTRRGAVLFTGPSGNGKSTILSALVQRGYPMLSDDVTAVVLDDDGYPIVLPGYPQIKIWADAAKQLGNPTVNLHRLRPQLEKFALPARSSFAGSPARLHAIYVLGSHNEHGGEIRLETLEGSASFTAIRYNTYRQRFLDGLEMRPVHFRLAAAAAKAARVVRVTRPKQPFLLDELADRIQVELG
jgi:hypothetical protein